MTSSQINDLTGPVVIFCIVATFAIMAFRLIRHVASRRRSPLLLKRDFLLYLPLATYVLGSQWYRYTGNSLAGELWWTVLTNVLVVIGLVTFLLIEVGVIGRGSDEEDRWS